MSGDGSAQDERDTAPGYLDRLAALDAADTCSNICGDHDCTGCEAISPAAEVALGVVVLLALIAVSWALLGMLG